MNTDVTSTQPIGFALNSWYVIASTDEVGHEPLGRVVCDVPIVLFRGQNGTVSALHDRCSHRRFALSLGRVVGDELVCGYHGFTYNCAGTCVAVPGQESIPSRADVPAVPVVQKGAWIFVWPGDPALADEALLPDLPWLTDSSEWTVVWGMRPLPARYELLVDNLLDLSHETYLHAGFIGTPEVAATPIETTVGDNNVIYVSRHMDAVTCPAFYERSTGMTSPIDRWQDIEYHAPGVYILHSRIAPVGLDPAVDEHRAAHVKVLYGITPSTSTSCYDFWAVARDFAIGDVEVSEFMEKMNDTVVMQDVVALTELEQRVAADTNMFEVNIKIDKGGLAARRVLDQLIAAT
jgi:phenylpropionate dioxygenase-like ring-hydroxylating dioxygenase large terminal subunit